MAQTLNSSQHRWIFEFWGQPDLQVSSRTGSTTQRNLVSKNLTRVNVRDPGRCWEPPAGVRASPRTHPRAHLVLSLVWTSCSATSLMLKLHSLSPVDSFSTFSIGFFSINSIFSQHFLWVSSVHSFSCLTPSILKTAMPFQQDSDLLSLIAAWPAFCGI